MPSKKSKGRPAKLSLWTAAPGCSEEELARHARRLAEELRPRDRVFLEGPLGAGKSTFARCVLEALGVGPRSEGSPTFAIAHEYKTHAGELIHIDLYRVRAEEELEDSGINAFLWEREAIVLVEWASLWPGFDRIAKSQAMGRVWEVALALTASEDLRDLEIRERPKA